MELSQRITDILNVSVIADCMGSYLSLNDLRNCRIVSKRWCSWSTLPYRKIELINVRRLTDLQKLTYNTDADYEHRTYRRFKFMIPLLEGKCWSRHMDSFWASHSTSISYLMLKDVNYCSVPILLDILYRKTPNLKTLIITNCFHEERTCKELIQFMDSSESQNISVKRKVKEFQLLDNGSFFNEEYQVKLTLFILRLYPSVQVLHIRNRYASYFNYEYEDTVLKGLIAERDQDPDKNFRVRELYLNQTRLLGDVGRQESLARTLSTLAFPLTVLTMNIIPSTPTLVVKSIMETFHGTLKKLDIYRSEDCNPYAEFPFGLEFPNLKIFRLTNYLSPNLEFLKCMPNLEVLHYCGVNEKSNCFSLNQLPCADKSYKTNVLRHTRVSRARQITLERLKELRFDYDCTSEDIYGMISVMMPNVEVAHLSALQDFDEVVPSILDAWGETLRKLTLRIGRKPALKTLHRFPQLKDLEQIKLFSSAASFNPTISLEEETNYLDNHGLPDIQ